MAPLSLRVVGLAHRWPGAERDTPESLSFEIAAGGRGLLLGPNGAGKSTLFARLVGLLAGPGEVWIGERQLTRRSAAELRRGVGLLWQRPEDGLLLPRVLDDVALGPANDGRRSESLDLAAAWLGRLGIAHLALRRVRDLSAGERQWVALAGLLAREPGLLLLDEPAAALDAAGRERLPNLLAGLPATILVATHEPELWRPRGWPVVAELGRTSLRPPSLSSGT